MSDPTNIQERTATCAGCDELIALSWTEQHELAACFRCGVDYVVHLWTHKRPSCRVNPKGLEIFRRYRVETGGRFPGAAYNTLGKRRGTVQKDYDKWRAWLDAHPDLFREWLHRGTP